MNKDIDTGICYNNRAVIELKKKNLPQARVYAIKVIQLIEPRVFGFIQSGLVQKNSERVQ